MPIADDDNAGSLKAAALHAFAARGVIAFGVFFGAVSLASADPLPSGLTCTGACGVLAPDGVVTAPPSGASQYFYVTTNGGLTGAGQLPGVGGTNGSLLQTDFFSAKAGAEVKYYFNYVTSDGAGFSDYAFSQLLSSENAVVTLFTARTRPSSDVSPGFGLPSNDAILTPLTSPIQPGTTWSALGGSSGSCYSQGCGHTGWISATYVVPQDGSYSLVFGVSNFLDTAFHSGLAFDGLTVDGEDVLVCVVDNDDNNCIISNTTDQTKSINALGGSDTLQLGGTTEFSFALGGLGSTYTNFEALEKAGASIVTLSGSGTFAGPATISAGTLAIGAGASLTGLTELINNATLDLGANSTLAAGTITNNSGATINVGDSATLQGTGNTLDNSGTLNIATTGNVTDAGDINNLATGVINFNGPGGTATLSSGTGVIANDGIINVLDGNVAVTGLIAQNNHVNVTGGNMTGVTALAAGATSVTDIAATRTLSVGTFTSTLGGGLTGTGTLNASTAFVLDDLATSVTLAGTGQLQKTGAGTVTLNAANTYSGGTQLNAGLLVLGDSLAAGTNAITAQSGALGYGNGVDVVNLITLTVASTDLSQVGGTATQSGLMSGAGFGINKVGDGALVLSSANTYTGQTNVSEGILRAGVSGAFGSNALVEIAEGAALDVGGFDQNFSTLTGGGTLINSGGAATLMLGALNSTSTFNGQITTNGLNLIKEGTGKLTLSNATGVYTTAFTTGTITVSGGELVWDSGVDQTIGGLNGAGNLSVLGGGNLLLNGVGNFSGTLNVDSLTSATTIVIASVANAFGDGATVNVGDAAELRGNAANGLGMNMVVNMLGNDSTLSVGGDQSIGSLAGVGRVQSVGQSYTLTIGSANTNTSFNGYFDGAMSVVKTGNGTLTLGGGDLYTTNTTINGGTLALAWTGVAAGSVTNNATFTNSGTVNGGFTNNSAGTATNNAGATINGGSVNFGIFANNGALTGGISNAGTFDNAGSIIGVVTNNGGTINLNAGGALNGGAVNNNGAPSILNVNGTTTGIGTVVQTAGATTNVNSNATFSSLDGAGAVNLAGATLTTGGNGSSTAFLGLIAGSGGLTKTGGGTFVLTGANTYAGATTISGGTLQIGDGGAAGSLGSGVVTNNATLAFYRSDAVMVANVITSTGTINQIGSGTTILSGNSGAFAGMTNVNAGLLFVNGSLGGAVNVNNGGTLGGSGALGGAVTVNAGGTLASGNSPGTLTVGALTLNSGSTSLFELATASVAGGATNDLVIVSDASGLTLEGGTITVTQGLGFSAGQYTLFQYNGSLGGSVSNLALTALTGGFFGNLDHIVGGAVVLNVAAASELVYWNGSKASPTGAVVGGNGTWDFASYNFTNAAGTVSGHWAGNANQVVFAGTGGVATISAGTTVAPSSMTFGVNGYTVTGADAASRFQLTAATPVSVTNAGDTATISAEVSGGGSLTKNGAGTLILSAANTYSGGTTVSAGTLQVASSGGVAGDVTNDANFTNIGAVSGLLTNSGASSNSGTINGGVNNLARTFGSTGIVNGGLTNAAGAAANVANQLNGAVSNSGVLNLTGATTGITTLGQTGTGAFNLNNNSTTIGSLAGVGAVNLGSATLTTGGNNSSTNFGGVIAGTGGLTKTGTGTFTLTGLNIFTGLTNVQAGGLTIAATGAVGDGVTVASSATLSNAGTVNGLLTNSGTSGNTGTIQSGVSNLAGAFTSTGIVNGGLTNAAGATANVANQLNGAVSNSGVLNLTGATTGITTLGQTGTGAFNLNNNSTTIGSLAGVGAVNLGSTTLTTGGNNSSTNFGGVISGAGGLTKTGLGTMALSGANTYAGATTVNGGTLNLAGGAAINDAGAVTVSGAGTLALSESETIGSLSGVGSVALNANTLTAGGNNASTSYTGTTSGVGELVKTGSGTLSTAALGHAGLTTIAGGTLNTNGAIAGGVKINAGTIFSGNATVHGTVTNAGTAGPGNSPGIMSYGSYVGAGGSLAMEVDLAAASPVAGTHLDQVNILGNSSGTSTVINLAQGNASSAAATSGLGMALVTVNGTVASNAFSMSQFISNGYTFSLLYRQDFAATTDGFFLVAGGCQTTTGNDICLIDAAADQQVPINGQAGTDTLNIGGTANFIFDLDGVDPVYQSFEAIIKSGASSITLAGTTAFSGPVTVNQGELINSGALNSDVANNAIFTNNASLKGGITNNGTFNLNAGGNLNNATIANNSLGTLNANGATSNIGAVTQAAGASTYINAAAAFGSFAGAGTVNLAGSNVLTVGGNNASTTFSGVFAGSGGLTKTGAGVFTLTGANTYTGDTVVLAGTLKQGVAGAFSQTSAISIGPDGSVDFGGFATSLASLSGSGALDITGTTLTVGSDGTSTLYSGNLSGEGGKLIKVGGGLLALSGNNTFSGGIDILHGGIGLWSSTAGGTGPITTYGSLIDYGNGVDNGTPIIISSNTTQFQVLVGSAEQSGPVSESGGPRPFEKIGAGELVLSAANSFTGTTTISNGTLTVRGGQALNDGANVAIAAAGSLRVDDSETVGHVAGSGALVVDAGSTLTLGGNNASALFAGNSSGAGDILKTGTGNWLLAGNNALSGTFTVGQGSVTVLPSGTLANMNLSISSGATVLLGGSPQGANGGGATGTGLGAINAAGGGTLYLDDNTSLSGTSLTLAAGANLNLFLTTSATPHPQITVASANVSGANLGVYLDPLSFSGTAQLLFDYDNVIASSAVTGTFANATVFQSPGPLFTVSTSVDSGGVDVQVQRLAFSDIIPDPNANQAGVGAALEEIFVGGVSDPDLINLIQAIGTGNVADIVVLYSNVSGSIAAEAVQAAARTDDPFKQTVTERVNVARTPGCTVAGETWCLRRYAQAAPQGPVMSDIEGDPRVFEWLDTGIRDAGTTSVWGRALAAWSDSDGSANAPGGRQTAYGFVGGVDRVFDSAFLAGVAGQYMETEADFFGSRNKSSLQSVQFGAYASYGGAETYLNGTLSAIGSQGKSEREFRVGLIDYEISSFMRSWTASASAELGTVIEDDGFRFEPSLGLNYAWTTTEDYAERGGGGLGLIIRPNDSQSLRSVVGARLSRVFDLGDRKIVPQLRFDWRHEMMDRGQSFNAAFAAAPDMFFAVEGTEYARDQVAMGASITAPLTGNLTGYADLQTAFSADTASTMASVGVRATW